MLEHLGELPAIPTLPKRSPAESMVAQAVLGIRGITVGQYGIASLISLGKLMASVYITCVLFVVVILGGIALTGLVSSLLAARAAGRPSRGRSLAKMIRSMAWLLVHILL